MKKCVCALMLAAVACSAQAGGGRRDMTKVSGEYGDVHFHGRVYVSPCVLAMASRNQTVDLGEISARSFHHSGDRSRPVRVSLYLNDCHKGAGHTLEDTPGQTSAAPEFVHSTVEQGVSITLMAEGDPDNRDLARISGDVQGAGIRILTMKEKPVALNQTERMLILKPGDNAVNFLAALESTGREVTAGKFRGLIRLKLEYL
ncbi:fimbrial protein [Pluralibacter gergoviae]|uniref:fimbrial protein n=1 Tax=Pluralibacter gergoviae TaxID=61647 RepID=UPI000A3BF3CA|nr:fimbrial protein [Pluralibacter gergoviae]EKT9640795.1 type 1 fimbrial protein [Pluralibacter gergoviae]EKV3541592.1 type 1 fimbrial protein [Pluralibacter gergoviae]EKV9897618.1 type 1 fimbrial protein [Pluralibacter gergoviae]EKV9930196.1 type 1 fimbrial protein [Pluralibacter gergoviae]EKW9976713.1 type 1 fimbrial protein [Pluralibacter gergoviae]